MQQGSPDVSCVGSAVATRGAHGYAMPVCRVAVWGESRRETALEVMGWMWMRGADFARAIFGATPRRERAGDLGFEI